MPTTSNFGWTTPADTDLVKDGALAIRTLGNGIDTSMADLKGGTTGQVLSKTSNTDMDFTWVTTDDANAIQNAIVDAKGDLIAASANDTPARLAVGNNGDTLLADSAATTGLRWSAQPAASNPVINGGMDIWQRGTSTATSTGVYTADRWMVYFNGTGTVTRQATSDTTNLPFIQYCARIQRTSGQTTTNAVYFNQNLESVQSIPYAGKTVTLSFYARAGANFSASSNQITTYLVSGTGTDQNVITGAYTGSTNVISQTTTLTTTWQRFSYTGNVGATATELAIYWQHSPSGTAGANDYYEITGVQLDVGSVALPFRRSGNTLAGELAACQRYYYRNAGGQTYSHIGFGMSSSTTAVNFEQKLPVTMRTKPASIEYANVAVNLPGSGNTALTGLTITATESSPDIATLNATVASGLTQYRTYFLLNDNNAAGYVGYSAEL